MFRLFKSDTLNVFRLVTEYFHNAGLDVTGAEIHLEFVNSGYICDGGPPTLNNYSSETNEIWMPNHLSSAMQTVHIFATHTFGSNKISGQLRVD